MPNKHKILNYSLIAIGMIGIGVGGYFLYQKYFLTKLKKAQFIISNGFYHSDAAQLATLDDNFINDWYNAARKGQATFQSGTGVFSTIGGKTVQNVTPTAKQ